MYIIHFRLFAGNLTIDTTGGNFTPINSPICIYFTLQNEHSKHEILKEFSRYLKTNKIDWIRPLSAINQEWIIDLSTLKEEFKMLEKESYLTGKITLEPKYEKTDGKDEITDETIIKDTKLKFRIDPNEMFIYEQEDLSAYSLDIKESLTKFQKDYPNNRKCAFLMMKFEDTPAQAKIVQRLKEMFSQRDIYLLRADDKYYSDDLLNNIRTYMHGCYFGVAIFERINSEYFNPNVSLEIGYMMALKKPMLFLKDKSLKSLHTDLIGKLYTEFDFQNISNATFNKSIDKWLKNHDLLLD